MQFTSAQESPSMVEKILETSSVRRAMILSAQDAVRDRSGDLNGSDLKHVTESRCNFTTQP